MQGDVMESFLHLEAKLPSCRRLSASVAFALPHFALENGMGKYIFAWILGVPAVVLVGIYLIAHL
jgi:hypothetical protein